MFIACIQKDTTQLCYEFYENFIQKNNQRKKNYPNKPEIKIVTEIKWWQNSKWGVNASRGYKKIFDSYMKSIDKEILEELGEPVKSHLGRQEKIIPFNKKPRFFDPVGFESHLSSINRNNNFGGIIHYGVDNYRIYYIDFKGVSLSKENQTFWNWYKKHLMYLQYIMIKI